MGQRKIVLEPFCGTLQAHLGCECHRPATLLQLQGCPFQDHWLQYHQHFVKRESKSILLLAPAIIPHNLSCCARTL